MTLIEIKPHRWGWKAFEAPGVEPVFPKKDQAVDYAQNRACFSVWRLFVSHAYGSLKSPACSCVSIALPAAL
jgi:hypothetical protein